MEVIGSLISEFKRARHYRRAMCPHGHWYADADCTQCPTPLYGYDKRFTLGDIVRLVKRALR